MFLKKKYEKLDLHYNDFNKILKGHKDLVLHFCNDTFQYCVPGGVLGESIERAQKGKVA